MAKCFICKKQKVSGKGTFFRVPKDDSRRKRWSDICRINFRESALICVDHFSPAHIIQMNHKAILMPNAVPLVPSLNKNETEKTLISISRKPLTEPKVNLENLDSSSTPEVLCRTQQQPQGDVPLSTDDINTDVDENTFVVEEFSLSAKFFQGERTPIESNLFSTNQKGEFKQNFLKTNHNAMQLHETVSSAVSTQTNTRLCGTVQVSDFADEYRVNCFYYHEVFPLEKWKKFVNHLNKNHFEEEAFKITKYVSEDHDYTPINLSLSSPADADFERLLFNIKSHIPFPVDPLEPRFESVILNSPPYYCIPDEHKAVSEYTNILNDRIETEISSNSVPIFDITNMLNNSKNEPETSSSSHSYGNNFSKERNLHKNSIKNKLKQISKQTSLNRRLKRTSIEMMEQSMDQASKSNLADNVQLTPAEIAFENTPGEIIDVLLDNMKNYPVLWQFDDEPFNEDFYEAVENLCKIINDKFSLNIDNLKMRRSINRILRFYCYLFPNDNVENVDQFTRFYDKCATFLPSAVNEVAYARCSHCFVCYRNDFDLKRHLLEEQKHLQWPYKCVKCKECFKENYEYKIHKRLLHYHEIFRCEPCNRTFVRRNVYNKHLETYHPKDNSKLGKYVCNICGKVCKSSSHLNGHKIYHGEKKYACHLCPKSYFVNAKLMLHLKSHRKEYNLMCELCGKGFIRHTNLREHMKKHTGAKISCNICNLKLRKSSLNRHLRTVHVACEGTIETAFRAKNHHYKTLLRPRPSPTYERKSNEITYHCKMCKINFENYKSVVEHNKLFHSDIEWPCKICCAIFRHKLNLKRHYRRKHNLHVFQVIKLVDKNEDLNDVLAISAEQLDKLADKLLYSVNSSRNRNISNIKTAKINSIPLPYEICNEEEKLHSSTIQVEIMHAEDNNVIQETNIDYINDFFTEF